MSLWLIKVLLIVFIIHGIILLVPSGDYSGSTRYLHELFLYKFNEARKKRSGRTALSKIR